MVEYTGNNEIIKKLDEALKQIKSYKPVISTLEIMAGLAIMSQAGNFRPTDPLSTVYGASSIVIGGTLVAIGGWTLGGYISKIRDTIKSCRDYVISQEPKK